jgi:hypothetical protein
MRPLRRIGCALAFAVVLLLTASNAQAYPWMIRHGYAGCLPCHTDPSGGAGALTAYGRAQSDLLLRTHSGPAGTSGEADPSSGFLGGLVPLPEALRLGGDFREAFLSNKVEGAPLQQELITMRADAYADLKLGRFRAEGALGYVPEGDREAALTTTPTDNVVSREHWLGVELDDDGAWLLRGGRIALPFGIRMIEHTLWTRVLTRTDLDESQEYGASLSFSRNQIRGEAMAIVGNFQIRPDAYRERGYSAYVELAALSTLAVGASSLFTRATRDIVYGVTDYRYANGIFARYVPAPDLVLLAEADSVYQSLTWNGHRDGYAAFAQADYEPLQGVHLMVTGEAMNSGSSGEPPSFDAWLSGVWFLLPHTDVRLDGILSTLGTPASPGGSSSYTHVTTWLAQFHVFL